jgi:NTE family protein
VVPYSLLDPTPLAATVADLIDFDQIRSNICNPKVGLRALAVVASAAHTNRSVVFHDGGGAPVADRRRGIDYVPTAITAEHVRASAAIPVAFPGVDVRPLGEDRAWYFDGGTRLNAPIRPALALQTDRVIVIGLNSVSRAPPAEQRPDLFDGLAEIVQGLLVDPLANEIATLATINQTLRQGATGTTDQPKVVPYIFITPQTPNAIGQIASRVYREYYAGWRGRRRSRDISLLGRMLGAERNAARGELFSYLFFAPEFTAELIELGRGDARRWIDATHDDGAWQRGPLDPVPPL